MRIFKTKHFSRFARRGNVEDDELATAREIARLWLEADGKALAKALSEGIIEEVDHGKEEKN